MKSCLDERRKNARVLKYFFFPSGKFLEGRYRCTVSFAIISSIILLETAELVQILCGKDLRKRAVFLDDFILLYLH